MKDVNVSTEGLKGNIQGANDDLSVANSTVIYNKNLTEQSKVDALYDYLGTAKMQIAAAMAELKPHTSYHDKEV